MSAAIAFTSASFARPHVLSPGLTASEGALDLVPIPCALAVLVNGEVRWEVANRLFARAGLSRDPLLSEAVVAFLTSDAPSHERLWHAGHSVERRFYRLSCVRVTQRAEPVCLVSFLDRTAEVRTRDTLTREMATDSLTGLPNRTGFGDAVEAMVKEGTQRWAVLMIDLGRFSRFNTCLGSITGDELLITVARRIKGALRATDVLSRTGGDEFGVLLAIDRDDAEADHVAKRIRGALATPFRLSDYEIRVSCAVGIAFGDADTPDSEDVIRHAQVAMKRSKASGDPETYQALALDSARAEFALETELRRAIENGDLTLAFQPICDLEGGPVRGFEALARWTDERGTVHHPSAFVPVAEESGLIVPLGRWALDAATRALADWDKRAGPGGCGLRMSVNLSPIQLQRDSVPLAVERALANAGLSGERLCLEITESAIVSDPDRSASVLMALKRLGTTVAMDDFGTGFSNLASLQKLPIDVLKIDRSFITGMLADRDKIAIVRAILSLSQALGMKTIAEGIETGEVAQTLAALGCTAGQGYLYARPLDADAAYAFLSTRAVLATSSAAIA